MPEADAEVVVTIGVGDKKTKLTINKNGRKSEEYYGPVTSSTLAKNDIGTNQWIDHIYVSKDPDPNTALQAASQAIRREFGMGNDPWERMGSSKCGLNATLHIVGEPGTPRTLKATYMELAPPKPGDPRPYINSITAWESASEMTAAEKTTFNSVAKSNVKPPRLSRLKPLK